MSAVRRALFVAAVFVLATQALGPASGLLVVQAFPPSLSYGEARRSAQRGGGRPASGLAQPQAPRAQDFTVTVNGLRLHYLLWTVDSGVERPTIVLLHGIARHAHTFDHLAPKLLRTHNVLALDMRGHGDSAWSPEGAY